MTYRAAIAAKNMLKVEVYILFIEALTYRSVEQRYAIFQSEIIVTHYFFTLI